MRAALIDPTGLVVNVILVGEGYEPPDGLTLTPLEDDSPLGPGWTVGNGDPTPPPEPPEPPPSETRQLRLDLDQLIVDAMFGDFPPQF